MRVDCRGAGRSTPSSCAACGEDHRLPLDREALVDEDASPCLSPFDWATTQARLNLLLGQRWVPDFGGGSPSD